MTQLTPYLCVADARAAIKWYVATLGAEVTTSRSSWTTAGSGTASWRSARHAG